LDKKRCDECGDCLEACPKKPLTLGMFNCRHCAPADAPCAQACEIKAFEEKAGNGTLTISDNCTGADCGECFSCPWGAIVENREGKAAKCDLCAAEGEAKCVLACKKNALFLRRDSIGWRIECEQHKKILDESGDKKTVIKNGLYLVKRLHELHPDEEDILHALVSEFRERAGDGAPSRESVSRRLNALLKEKCEEYGLLLEKDRGQKIVEVAEANTFGYGVLDPLLEDDSIEEITVVGKGKPIYVFHREKGWLETNCCFTDDEFAVNTVNKMARSLGRRITFENPRLNATLPDGSRLHATIPPVSVGGVEMTIRKFRKSPFTPADLIANGTISAEAVAFLSLALFGDSSLLIAGNTSSGKTTTLNALFSFVPLSDRVIITEETPELSIPHKHSIRIVANEEAGISMKDLVKDTLRMRPDRVIIGEVRSKDETEALFDSLLAGQARGSYATFHAGSADEACARLKALGASEDDLNAIDLVLVQRRMLAKEKGGRATELRRATELCEIQGSKPAKIFEYDNKTERLEKKRFAAGGIAQRIADTHKMTVKELEAEVRRRAKKLEALVGQKPSYAEFTREVQEW